MRRLTSSRLTGTRSNPTRSILTTASALSTAALLALALSGCGTTEPAATAAGSSGEEITLTDASGATVTLDGPATKVIGTEWNVVEDLVTLGVDPVGVADVKGYTAWDTAVPLTNDPKDIGTRGEPSMDTIASLSPDLIVATTDLSDAAVEQLRKIAPVLEVRSADASDQLGLMMENLDLIAQATGTTAKAATVKTAFDAKIAEGKKAITDAGLAGTKIAFADGWVDANQVSIRPYTAGSLIGTVNEELGLQNAWTMDGDKDYGLAQTDVEGLTGLGDTQFAYIANDATDGDPFASELAKNAVWASLPFVTDGKVHRLPDGIWMFGGPKSMEAYIDAVVGSVAGSVVGSVAGSVTK